MQLLIGWILQAYDVLRILTLAQCDKEEYDAPKGEDVRLGTHLVGSCDLWWGKLEIGNKGEISNSRHIVEMDAYRLCRREGLDEV